MKHINNYDEFLNESLNESLRSNIITGLIALASFGLGTKLSDVLKQSPQSIKTELTKRKSDIDYLKIEELQKLKGLPLSDLEKTLDVKVNLEMTDSSTNIAPGEEIFSFHFQEKEFKLRTKNMTSDPIIEDIWYADKGWRNDSGL
jgi:hypothetical protein